MSPKILTSAALAALLGLAASSVDARGNIEAGRELSKTCQACHGTDGNGIGDGQYPNLAVSDPFCCVRRGDLQHVVRASKVLDDRMNTSVGPMRVEVVEPLRRVRFVCDPSSHPRTDADSGDLQIACDLLWAGAGVRFGLVEQVVGITPLMGGTQRRRACGREAEYA